MSEEHPRNPDRLHSDEQRFKAALKVISAEWDRRLAPLQEPDARERLESLLAAKGRAKTRSKAGESF